MTILKGHFDGKVLVPDEPVNLPLNCSLEISVQPLAKPPVTGKSLLKLMDALRGLPANENWPTDGAEQHDHYLFGTDKRP